MSQHAWACTTTWFCRAADWGLFLWFAPLSFPVTGTGLQGTLLLNYLLTRARVRNWKAEG